MQDYYDGYYEHHDGDDVVVHLDYSDPEPSLFRATAKKASSRPQLSLMRDSRISNNRRDRKVHFESHEKNKPLMQDYRDDLYSDSLKRVNIQEQRYHDHAHTYSRSKESSVSSLSHGAIDLSSKASDSSFELFVTLLTDHISPNIKNNSYILDEVDIAYVDAILPESFRESFVRAVNERFSRLPKVPRRHESPLEKSVRTAQKLGLGLSKNDNFLLGGGQRIKGGKIRMDIVDTNVFPDRGNMSISYSADGEEFRSDSEFDDDESDINGPKDTNELSNTELIDLIKSLDDLGDQDIALLKDSGLPKNQISLIELAIASKKASQINQVAEYKEDLEIRKANIDDTKKLKVMEESDTYDTDPDRVKETDSSIVSKTINTKTESIKRRNKWNDGLFDALAHGCFHPFLVLTWCAPIYALAQVMTRLNLNWIGKPATDEKSTKDIYRNLNMLLACCVGACSGSIYYFLKSFSQNGSYNISSIVIFASSIIMVHIFTIYVTSNTRKSLREKFDIPDDFATDFTLSLMYLRLVIAQMGRQTANYRKESAFLFTATGLRERSRTQKKLIIISNSISSEDIV